MIEKIEVGDKFRCKKSVDMGDGEIAYIKGKVYVSEIDGCITDEQGRKEHMWGRLRGLPSSASACFLNFPDYTSTIFETYEYRKHKRRKLRTGER